MHATGAKAATILVVDDDALINIGTVDMLSDLGHVALEAFSGQQALEILSTNPAIDIIITDYSMPGMSGLELASRARQLRPGLAVLLATGYDELPDGAFSDLPRLSKPFRHDELVSQLDRLLERA